MDKNHIKEFQLLIEDAFDKKNDIPNNHSDLVLLKDSLKLIIDNLDSGKLQISEKISGKWVTHQWLKKAIILFFKIMDNKLLKYGNNNFFDKCSMKFDNWDKNRFHNSKIRVIPPASVRYGAYISNNTVIMPSYINIGSYIDTGTMIDTWASVGSCAHIGKQVHLSGGAGIGGVLEPIQNNPTIIEDNCFIGARSEIVEGVIIEEGSVISMGVFIGQSTKIYDRNTEKIYYGRVPAGSVVVPGTFPSKDGKVNTYCAVIVKTVDLKTKDKIKINDLLRF